MKDKVQNVILESNEILCWIDSKIENLQVNSTPKERVSGACLYLALIHYRSIVLLISNGLTGSACSLLRPLFEAFIRGVWIHLKATDKEVDKLIKKDILNKSFDKLVKEVETVPGYDTGILIEAKEKTWKALNSYVHCGFLQIQRGNTADSIESNYSDEEKIEALKCANAYGLLSFSAMARLANNIDLQNAIWDKYPQVRTVHHLTR